MEDKAMVKEAVETVRIIKMVLMDVKMAFMARNTHTKIQISIRHSLHMEEVEDNGKEEAIPKIIVAVAMATRTVAVVDINLSK